MIHTMMQYTFVMIQSKKMDTKENYLGDISSLSTIQYPFYFGKCEEVKQSRKYDVHFKIVAAQNERDAYQSKYHSN